MSHIITLDSWEDLSLQELRGPQQLCVAGQRRQGASQESAVLQVLTPQSLLVCTTLKNGGRGLVPASHGLEKTISTLGLSFFASIMCCSLNIPSKTSSVLGTEANVSCITSDQWASNKEGKTQQSRHGRTI